MTDVLEMDPCTSRTLSHYVAGSCYVNMWDRSR